MLQRPNTGNLYALARMKQQQEAQQAEMAEKRRKDDQDYFDKAIALGKDPEMELVLNTDQAKITSASSKAIRDIYQDAIANGRPINRMAISQIQSNLQERRDVVSGFYNTYKQVLSEIDKNKEFINADQAREKLNKYKEDFISFDGDNNPVYDKAAAAKIGEFFTSKDAGALWNVPSLAKELKTQVGDMTSDIFDPSTNLTKKVTWSNILETEQVTFGNQTVTRPKLDKEGQVIVKTTPDAIAFWDKDPRRAAARAYAMEQRKITGEQFLKEALQPVAEQKSDVGQKFTPGTGTGQNRPQYQLEVKTAGTSNFTKLEDAKDGVTGMQSKELDFQQMPERTRTIDDLTDFAGNKRYGRFLKLSYDDKKRKGILIQPLYKKTDNPDGDPILIPSTGVPGEANLQALLNRSSTPSERKDIDNKIREQLDAPFEDLVADDDKLTEAVTGIKTLLTGKKDKDETQVKNDLIKYLERYEIKGVDVDTDIVQEYPGGWMNPANWGWDNQTISIEGKTYNLGDDGDVKLLKNYLHNKSHSYFQKVKGSEGTKTPVPQGNNR